MSAIDPDLPRWEQLAAAAPDDPRAAAAWWRDVVANLDAVADRIGLLTERARAVATRLDAVSAS